MEKKSVLHTKIVLLLAVLLLIMTGCSFAAKTNDTLLTDNDTKQTEQEITLKEVVAEVTEGEFIYRLVSKKEVYKYGEEVKLFAELEYVGESNKVTISHAASPFLFPIHEHTRDYGISYAMNQPLLSTTMTKGTALREYYGKSGGYSELDDKAYIQFIKRFIDEGFPEGHYTVNGSADFFVTDNKGENKRDYNLTASIDFKVN